MYKNRYAEVIMKNVIKKKTQNKRGYLNLKVESGACKQQHINSDSFVNVYRWTSVVIINALFVIVLSVTHIYSSYAYFVSNDTI